MRRTWVPPQSSVEKWTPRLTVLLAAHGDDADLLAVFLAEEGERALLHRLVGGHQPGRDLGIAADAPIDVLGHHGEILARGRHRLAVVEAQAVGRHQRALLGHMGAQTPAQRLMQQMGGRVIGAQP